MLGTLIPVCILLLTSYSQKSFVDPAPAKVAEKQGSPEVIPDSLDDNVKELEDLKQTIGSTLEVLKSHSGVYSSKNGFQQDHSNSRAEVKENGQLVGRIGQQVDITNSGENEQPRGRMQTEVEIPSKSIHKTLVEQLFPDYTEIKSSPNRRSSVYDSTPNVNAFQKFAKYSGTQYTPLDMAEYVFWTGDEEGVSLTIEEFLQKGIMNRQEAINFLQEIKTNLDYLQEHYTRLGLNGGKNKSKSAPKVSQNKHDSEQIESMKGFEFPKQRQQIKKKEPDFDKVSSSAMDGVPQQEAYEELLERLKVADLLYTEYSLEEIIYQLAKVMFTQSLTGGSDEAQKALQKFTTFLETEADLGHISKTLEKKVLDVLIASLRDTLSEHPDLAAGPVHKQATSEDQDILRRILQMNVDGNKNGATRSGSELQALRNSVIDMQLKDKSHPITLGKYKNIR